LLQPSGETPQAQAFANRTLSISNSHWLTDEHFEQVLKQLKAIVASPG
jgi:dTDP-4-amino-4,6-dideoxygalactose transaminase